METRGASLERAGKTLESYTSFDSVKSNVIRSKLGKASGDDGQLMTFHIRRVPLPPPQKKRVRLDFQRVTAALDLCVRRERERRNPAGQT